MPANRLLATLQRALDTTPATALCAGFSGGPDSTALLHALARLPTARARGLRALHVDHGLHTQSAAWAQRCEQFCAQLAVPLTVVTTTVDQQLGIGLEAAARAARYAAFAANLTANEWLVLAHHRDDQIETILLKLLRGAGPEGLADMRALRPLGRGSVWRPLLEMSRETVANYLIENNLQSIDDPSNADLSLTRNWLRHALLPAIHQHQPNADAAILHAARLCRGAADYIATAAATAREPLEHPDGTLAASGWLALPTAIRAPVLDGWLHDRGLPAPPDRARAELASQIACAAADRAPVIHWRGAEIRVWRDRLYATPPLPALPDDWSAHWDGRPLTLPAGCGTLSLVPQDTTAAADPAMPSLTVRSNHDGQRALLAPGHHRQRMNELLRNAGLPPWWRKRCPLIYADGQWLAAGDVVISAYGEAVFATLGAHPHWQRSGP